MEFPKYWNHAINIFNIIILMNSGQGIYPHTSHSARAYVCGGNNTRYLCVVNGRAMQIMPFHTQESHTWLQYEAIINSSENK